MGEKVTACPVDMKSQRQQVERLQYSKYKQYKNANVCNCRKLNVSPNQGAADSMRNVEDAEAEASLADKTEVRL